MSGLSASRQQRANPRVACNLPAILVKPPGHRFIRGAVTNISVGGAFFALDTDTLREQDIVLYRIGPVNAKSLTLSGEAQIRRISTDGESGCALRFMPLGTDEKAILQRLLRNELASEGVSVGAGNTIVNLGAHSLYDRVEVIGDIGDDFASLLDTLLRRSLARTVIFDFQQVREFSEMGQRSWSEFVSKFHEDRVIQLEACSPCVVEQVKLRPELLAHCNLVSVVVPLFCAVCNEKTSLVIPQAEFRAWLAEDIVGECELCRGKLDSLASLKDYFPSV